jgi:hypothetical protein
VPWRCKQVFSVKKAAIAAIERSLAIYRQGMIRMAARRVATVEIDGDVLSEKAALAANEYSLAILSPGSG